MSNLPHILSMAGPSSRQDEGKPAAFPDEQAGSPGLFEKLMAQALSSNSTESPISGNQNHQSQTSVQPAKIADVYPHETPAQAIPQQKAAPQPNLNSDSYSAETMGKNTVFARLTAVQSDSQTSTGSIAKAADASKTEKKSQTQTKSVTTNVLASIEITANQMPLVTISKENPDVQPRSEAASDAPASSQLETTIKSMAMGATPPAVNPVPLSATKISTSDFSEEGVTPTVQPVANTKSGLFETKGVELSGKNPEPSPAVDTKATTSSKVETSSKVDFAFGPESSTFGKSSLSTETTTESQPVADGTSIANQNMPMKQAEKTNKIAGQTEKVLPGAAVSAVREGTTLSYSPHIEQLTGTTATDNPAASKVEGAAAVSIDSAAAATVTNLRNGPLERIGELVALSTVRLSDSGNSSMQVVIKPDAGTQLSLELRQHGGSVEVQAVLQQGDFNHLSQQWPDLQQRLEQRGIRLAPLSDEGGSANNPGGHETFQQQPNQTTEMGPEITLVEAPAGMFTPETAQTPAHRGWETWA